ncbi:tetratricopeptide repeat-containing protein [Toxoplasma gondii GAB2-2007-GAL-DOM2]|uniref:Tetratricopeptide repeat-containing protein n=3 Tax=Toxoplasma gondii TaxID=5811 RepID=A0A086KLU7_TOXGO|nr:tetratricopeptide repeat-containing protein [Toxoplasma gondii GAB2-2007-GAL-DOM2]KFG45365.1 tetratricopeptide repeat-containing protein [Toxoplasma gondii FOU]RQX67872.1 tetratricopeptide repeat-containing protein [Toxoplasma gondii CAST]
MERDDASSFSFFSPSLQTASSSSHSSFFSSSSSSSQSRPFPSFSACPGSHLFVSPSAPALHARMRDPSNSRQDSTGETLFEGDTGGGDNVFTEVRVGGDAVLRGDSLLSRLAVSSSSCGLRPSAGASDGRLSSPFRSQAWQIRDTLSAFSANEKQSVSQGSIFPRRNSRPRRHPLSRRSPLNRPHSFPSSPAPTASFSSSLSSLLASLQPRRRLQAPPCTLHGVRRQQKRNFSLGLEDEDSQPLSSTGKTPRPESPAAKPSSSFSSSLSSSSSSPLSSSSSLSSSPSGLSSSSSVPVWGSGAVEVYRHLRARCRAPAQCRSQLFASSSGSSRRRLSGELASSRDIVSVQEATSTAAKSGEVRRQPLALLCGDCSSLAASEEDFATMPLFQQEVMNDLLLLLPLAPPSSSVSSESSFSQIVGERLVARLLVSSEEELPRDGTARPEENAQKVASSSASPKSSPASVDSPLCVPACQLPVLPKTSEVKEGVSFFLGDAAFRQASWGLLHRGLWREVQRVLHCPAPSDLSLCLGTAMLRSGRLQEALEFLTCEIPFEDLPSHIAAPLHLLLAELYDELGATSHGTEALCAACDFLPTGACSENLSFSPFSGEKERLRAFPSQTRNTEDLSFAIPGALSRLIGHARIPPEEEERVLSRLTAALSHAHRWWIHFFWTRRAGRREPRGQQDPPGSCSAPPDDRLANYCSPSSSPVSSSSSFSSFSSLLNSSPPWKLEPSSLVSTPDAVETLRVCRLLLSALSSSPSPPSVPSALLLSLGNARWQAHCSFCGFDFDTANSLSDFVLTADATDVDALATKASSLYQLGAARAPELEDFARRLRRLQGNTAISAFVTGKAALLGAAGDPEELRKAAAFFSEALSLLCRHQVSAPSPLFSETGDRGKHPSKPSSSLSSSSSFPSLCSSLLPTQRRSLAFRCFEALAQTHADLGEPRVAIQYLLRAARLQPGNHRVYLHLGMQELEESESTPEPSLRTQMLARAEMFLTQALEMQPKDPFVYNELARLHAARNRLDCSVWYLERAVLCSVRTAASPALFLSNLGLAYLRTHAFRKAERTFRAALGAHLRLRPASAFLNPLCESLPQVFSPESSEERESCAPRGRVAFSEIGRTEARRAGETRDNSADAADSTGDPERGACLRTRRGETKNNECSSPGAKEEETRGRGDREDREGGRQRREGVDFVPDSPLVRGAGEETEEENDEDGGFRLREVDERTAPENPFFSGDREETESEKKNRIFLHNLWLGLGVALYVQGNPICVGPLERALRLSGSCSGKSQATSKEDSASLTFLLYTAAIEDAPLLFPSLSPRPPLSLASKSFSTFLATCGGEQRATRARRSATEAGKDRQIQRRTAHRDERGDREEREAGANLVGKKRRVEGEARRRRKEVNELLDDVLEVFRKREKEREAHMAGEPDTESAEHFSFFFLEEARRTQATCCWQA